MNTSNKITPSQIKQMVEDWYSGSVDKNRDETLFAYFTETPESDIPGELREETEIFRSLSGFYTSCPDDELLDKIESEIKKERQKSKVGRLLHVSMWISAAACITALILGLSYFKIDNITEPMSTTLRPVTAYNKPVDTSGISTDTIQLLNPPTISDKIAVNSVPKSMKTKSAKLREVTDVNEAIAILRNIDNKLEKTLAIGVETIKDVETGFDKTTETTKKIFNNLSI